MITRISIIITLLILSACGAGSSSAAPSQSMLWNPGPNQRSIMELDGDANGACDTPVLTDLSGASTIGTPTIGIPLYCAGNRINPNGEAPSFFINTLWDAPHYGSYPGWGVWYLSGGYGTSMEFQVMDNAQGAPGDPCDLHEVSTSYIGERDVTGWSGDTNVNTGLSTVTWANPTVFKQMYDPRNFKTITGTFSAQLISVSDSSGCTKMPTQRIESDYAVQYFDTDGKILRTDVLGISVYNKYPDPHGLDTLYSNVVNSKCVDQYGNETNVCQVIIDGTKLGYPVLITGQYQTYNIEFLGPLAKYIPAPPSGTAKALQIVFELYATGRDTNISYRSKNMDLIGQ